jgi:hypothetical protein
MPAGAREGFFIPGARGAKGAHLCFGQFSWFFWFYGCWVSASILLAA